MKIYTKQGDSGQTGLFGGPRVPKDHIRIRAYGELDELNSVLGLVMIEIASSPLGAKIQRIQGELFQLGAELATPTGKSPGIQLIGDTHTAQLEREIDEMEAALPPLTTFILPGGSRSAATLHLARTLSRSAERGVVALHHEEPVRQEVLRYINRLSDYLFVCAREANRLAGEIDLPWIAPR